MRLLLQEPRKIGRTGIDFEPNEEGTKLIGEYKGEIVYIHCYELHTVKIVKDDKSKARFFAELSNFQLVRVKKVLE